MSEAFLRLLDGRNFGKQPIRIVGLISVKIQIAQIAGQTMVITYDPEAGVWYVQSNTVPGLTGKAASASDLIEEL